MARGGHVRAQAERVRRFHAAAEFLISKKYTNKKKLAIHGSSNGGLLTAVCSQPRPDLFGAVVTCAGVLDMLRFNKFTVGAAWVAEYGDPDKPTDFPYIFKYSPLHCLNVAAGVDWPSLSFVEQKKNTYYFC